MDDRKIVPLASEMYAELKKANEAKKGIIIGLLFVVGSLSFALIKTRGAYEPEKRVHRTRM